MADTHTIPHNLEAETGLLACLFLEGGQDVLLDCLADGFSPEHFYSTVHQTIFSAIKQLHDKGVPPDEIMVANKLAELNQLEIIGGHAKLYEISNKVSTTIHARNWLSVVKEKYVLRQLIRASQWTVEQAQNAGRGDTEELLNGVEAEFFKIRSGKKQKSMKDAGVLMDAVQAGMDKMLVSRGAVTGLPTGFTDLDRLIFGLHPSEMNVIAARPSLGKTAIAVNMVENLVLPSATSGKEPVPTLIFSLEMTGEQLVHRMVCSHARVDMLKLRDGICDRPVALADAAKLIKAAPLWIDDEASLNIYEMRSRARQMQRKHKIGLIIVDYLQLVMAASQSSSREQEVAAVSRNIKAMAKELNLPVVVLCQLNRLADREGRKPQLNDLRESGSIEQDADVVMLLSKPNDGETQESPDEPYVRRNMLIAKNRNGPIGEIALTFCRRLTRFENYTGHHP